MNKLAEIFAHKREELAAAKAAIPFPELKARASDLPPCRGFRAAVLADPRPVALIAEVKKASPSQGLIRPEFDPVSIARDYQDVGVTCLSVLTDERYFAGRPEYLRAIRDAVDLPLLRKDFICDPYQLYEARTWGADCVLLIVAGLDDRVGELWTEARALGLDVLVEVHDERECEVALELGSDLIGVNNRDLATFQTDLTTSERLIPMIAPYAVAVAESAISKFEDVERVRAAGARAVLIGTTFCACPSIGAKVKEVMRW